MTDSADLRFLLAIQDNGSLVATARALDVTPSAVSQRLQQLEKKLGTRLVDRTARSLRFTQEGALLCERGAELIRQLDEARRRASISHAGLSDSMHFGEKVRGNLSRYRGAWLVGAVLLGLVIAKIPPRTKKVKVPVTASARTEKTVKQAGIAGLALTVLKMGFDLGRPFLIKYLTQRMRARY